MISLTFSSLFLYSQDSTITLSKFEKFTSQTGRMFKTETKEVGKIKDILIAKVKTTDVETGESLEAIRIHQNKTMLMTTYTFGVLYIDKEEIDGVVKSLGFYLNQMKTGKPKYEPRFSYVTSNDVEVNCFYSEGVSGGWAVNLNKNYHYTRATVAGSVILLKNKDIDDFVDLMGKAKDAVL
jgi:hypothetical protein